MFSSVQFSCSVMSESLWSHELQHARPLCPSPWSLLKLMSIESVVPSNHLIPCCPLLLLPSIFPSIRLFSNESVFHIRWPKYWSFSFSISPSNEYSGLISFRMDWLDLLAVQGILNAQSYPTLCNAMDYSPPNSSLYEILQARILEWFACPPPGDLPNPGIKPASLTPPVSASISVSLGPSGKPSAMIQNFAIQRDRLKIWQPFLTVMLIFGSVPRDLGP